MISCLLNGGLVNRFRELPGARFCLLVYQCRMPSKCAASECNNIQGECPYSFHRFPAERDLDRRERWEAAVKRDGGWRSTEYSRLCGAHFVTGG